MLSSTSSRKHWNPSTPIRSKAGTARPFRSALPGTVAADGSFWAGSLGFNTVLIVPFLESLGPEGIQKGIPRSLAVFSYSFLQISLSLSLSRSVQANKAHWPTSLFHQGGCTLSLSLAGILYQIDFSLPIYSSLSVSMKGLFFVSLSLSLSLSGTTLRPSH